MQNPLLFSAPKVRISPFLKIVKCHKSGFKKRPRNDQNTEKEKEKERDILLGRRPWEGGEKEPLFSFLQGTVQEQKSKMR